MGGGSHDCGGASPRPRQVPTSPKAVEARQMSGKPPVPSPHSFERLVTRLSAQLAVAPLESVDEVIVSAQHAIIEFLDLDRSTLFLFDEKVYAAERTHLAGRKGYEQLAIGPPHLEFPWVASQIRAGRAVQFNRIDDLPPEADVDKATFRRVGPRSNVTYPLIAGGRVFGALAFGVMREERRWQRSVVRRLGLLAEIIANTLYRKRADEALRRSEARMNLALTAAGVGLWSWEVGADSYWASEQLRLLYHLSPDEVLSAARFSELIHEQDREAVRLAIEASLADHSDFRTEFRLLLPDGQMRWIACQGRHVDGFDKTKQMVGVSYDVTARARAEERERQVRADLAHVARTATLGELSASLAHELNQPLAAILSNAQAGRRLLAFETPDVEEARLALEDIVDDVKRAGEVIRRVRELVQKGTPETTRVDLEELIGDVLLLLQSDALHRRVRLERQIAPMPSVRVDRIQIQQVLINMLLNAFEAFPAEQVEREVRVVLEADGPRARISILDNGPGLSPEASEHLFQAFHSTKPQGLGIGLSLCRAIVEAHGAGPTPTIARRAAPASSSPFLSSRSRPRLSERIPRATSSRLCSLELDGRT